MNNLDSVSRALHTDVLLNWESVKCFGNEAFEAARYQTSLLDYQKAAYKVQASLNILNLVQTCIICAGTLATTMLVAASVVRGRVSPSQFVVFITYLSQVYGPLSMLGTLYRVSANQLFDNRMYAHAKGLRLGGPTKPRRHGQAHELTRRRGRYQGRT